MGLDYAEASKGDGLKTALDIVIAPKDAFERLRTAPPTWGWACALAIVLLIAGYAMQRQAQIHAAVGTVRHMMATSSLFSSMSDEEKQRTIERAGHPSGVQTAIGIAGVVASLFVAALLNTVFLLIAAIAGRGNADFGRLWAGSMNVAVPTYGLNYIVLGVICIALGPDHFQNSGDLVRALPGLATLAPGLHGFAGGFLLGLNVFTLWGFGLNVVMMRVLAGVTGAAAWIGPLAILLGGALITGGSSSFYGG
jgi:hypothetical protein